MNGQSERDEQSPRPRQMDQTASVWTHEPPGYDCPFCRLQRGEFNDRNQPSDVVAVTDLAYARISPEWWPNNPGAALVIPRAHVENLYGVPSDIGHRGLTSRRRWPGPCARPTTVTASPPVSTTSPSATRTSGTCTSTSFPRYADDQRYARHAESAYVDTEARAPFAERLASGLELTRTFEV